MNPLAAIFFIISAIALVSVPRKWAPVALLVGCCYMTMGQGVEVGPISLPIYRMLLLVGLVRVMVKGERISGDFNTIDKLILWWAAWIVFAGLFHEGGPGSGPIYAAGYAFNLIAVYFLIRIWCTNLTDVTGIIVVTAFLLAPIAAEMVVEKIVKINQFSVFGGVPHDVVIREGKYRAQGPFRHPILAGTVGAVCLPLFMGIWSKNRIAGSVGLASGIFMTLASASSGPVMSAMAGIGAVIMWKFRNLTRLARFAAVAAYFALAIVTGEPGYYVMKRIDISGGSTGYHRARLIESAIDHLDEWWLFGTDFTRHWMATGVSFSPNHADITNYYLVFGVTGGLVAMFLVIAILIIAFRWVGIVYRERFDAAPSDAFMIWCLGAGLFAHATTSVSVSYFDQSLVFFWMNVAIISSMYSGYLNGDQSETEEPDVEEEDGVPEVRLADPSRFH
jgi:hypothetical protein